MCGRCMQTSVPVEAPTPEAAWAQLEAIGWRWYVSQYGGRGYAECQTCSGQAHDVDADVKRAHTARKRK